MGKKWVAVSANIDECGNKTPTSIVYNEQRFEIDRVLDVKSCPSFKAGGIGERYTVRIGNSTTYLFCERGRWFVEEKA